MFGWLARRAAPAAIAAAILSIQPRLAAAAWTGMALLAQQSDGGAQNAFQEDPSRSYVVDGFLMILLAGAALFSVCRSSRRT